MSLQDIIQPEVFTPYVVQKTMELSALVQSGIAVNNEEFDELAGGSHTLVNMPFWNDLVGEEETITAEGYYTPLGINASKDVARKQMYGNMWSANGLASLLSGDDPFAAIGNLVSEYWARRLQQRLLATLEGVFNAPSMANKVLDISTLGGGESLLTGDSFLDALQLMGDAKGDLTGVMMNSYVETYLAKRQLIHYVQESEQNPRVPYFMNKRVVVDDSTPYDTATKTGSIYLFGKGALALGNGTHPKIVPTAVTRDDVSHAGEEYLTNRMILLLHPRGVKWTETNVAGLFPERDELRNGSNWERVFEEKAIRIVKHTFSLNKDDTIIRQLEG